MFRIGDFFVVALSGFVIPKIVKQLSGIQKFIKSWIPAFAEMTFRRATRFFTDVLSFLFIAAILVVTSTIASAKMIEVKDLYLIEEAVKRSDKDTLVVFDVKGVLMQSSSLIRTPQYKHEYKELVHDLSPRHSAEELSELMTTIAQQEKMELVNKKILDILADMSRRQIKSVALTNVYSGKFGDISEKKERRIHTLEKLGISFKNCFKNVPAAVFDNVRSAKIPGCASFKDGIIFTCNAEKGEVLWKFFELAKYWPKKIIFVDNAIKNTESVEAFAAKHRVAVETFLYTEAENRPKPPLSKEHMLYQFNYLEKHHKWLSDEQVSMALKVRNKKNRDNV